MVVVDKLDELHGRVVSFSDVVVQKCDDGFSVISFSLTEVLTRKKSLSEVGVGVEYVDVV